MLQLGEVCQHNSLCTVHGPPPILVQELDFTPFRSLDLLRGWLLLFVRDFYSTAHHEGFGHHEADIEARNLAADTQVFEKSKARKRGQNGLRVGQVNPAVWW